MVQKPAVCFSMDVWGETDVGMKRRLNEDVFIVEETMGLFLVADGMGGHAAGEVASRLAAGEIIEVFRSRMNSEGDTWPEHWNVSTSATANLLVDAILSGHERVTSAVSQDANLKGMGTTVVAAVHPPMRGSLTICHVGDSRAYRLRGEELTLLTQDHSWVHEQVAAGFLTEEAARSHPLKNVVTQALGGSSQPRVDILDTEIEDGDLFLLCSDGLNSMLTDSEIAAAMMEDLPLDGLTQKLIILANERGGNDNITVVLLRPVPTECGEEPFE